MSGNTPVSRRTFLTRTAAGTAAVAMFHIVPRHVLGGPGYLAPSQTITRAIIGCGTISADPAHLRPNQPGTPPQTLAVCDVDQQHLADRLRLAGEPCKPYADWRYVLDHKDIDVVHICTPPHWHALMAVAAAQAGFDIWCETPMTRFIAEGQHVIDAVRRYGRVLGINVSSRADNYYGFGHSRLLKKLVRSGLLGQPLTVRVGRSTGFDWKVRQWTGRTDLTPQPVPGHLDYDMWLGPAPDKPYHPHRVHTSFRGYWDYDGGGLADMGQHYLDPIQYILDKDDTSPVEVQAKAPWPPHPDAVGLWQRVDLTYDDGTHLILDAGPQSPTDAIDGTGNAEPPAMPLIQGPRGKVFAAYRTDPPGLFEQLHAYPDPEPMLFDFDESVRTRQTFGLNEVNANRSTILIHLANAAIRTGRKLRFDPVNLRFVDDDDANRLVNIPMRAPWHL
ncbi:MAG: Gfo/Idh/MocA family oxidoreductase [Phycisphaeraceae bacterium]